MTPQFRITVFTGVSIAVLAGVIGVFALWREVRAQQFDPAQSPGNSAQPCPSPSLHATGVLSRGSLKFEGTSMLPTIQDGESVTFDKFAQDDEIKVEPGDIVVFWYPEDPSKIYIKRLIGMPGDKVEIVEGAVIVNGKLLDEPYIDPRLNLSRRSQLAVYIKPHYFYVLGDNRDNSSDSRMWGLVPEKYIFGRVKPQGGQAR